MKKVLCLILSFVMIFSISVPTMAANLEPSNDLTERSSIYLSKEVQLDISLNRSTKQNDSPDSFEITQFNNGQLSRKVTLSDDGQFLLGTEYVAGVAVRNYIINIAERVQKLPSMSSSAISKASSKEYVIGYITFNPLIDQTTSERLKVFCDPYDTDNEAYVVNGKASDTLADIASILLSIFISYAFPAATLSEIVASAIVGFFGGKLTGEAIGKNFTENVSVVSNYYRFRSYRLSAGIYSNTYSGVSRRVTTAKSKYYGQWFHEGTTPSTWKDGDAFAIWCWYDMYGEFCPGVKSYT